MAHAIFTSYAQNMEDIRLWRALRDFTPGRYIDIGAWHPRIHSVSRGFYELGWRGLHFEPNPRIAIKLRSDRPDEIVYESAVSDYEGLLPFYLHGDAGTATGDADLAYAAAPPGRPPTAVTVAVTTLARACAHLHDLEIHWMKIDVEGMEASVLRGWDATTLRPWIIVIEATRPLTRIQTHETFEPRLVQAEYLPAGFDGLNRYYVAREHADLVSAVEEPVSVFDLMDGCCLSRTSGFVSPHLERPHLRDKRLGLSPSRYLSKVAAWMRGCRFWA